MSEGSMYLGGIGDGVGATAGGGVSVAAGGPDSGLHLSFHDILHGLNPLQYLPVIGMIYRAVTGDQIGPGWRIAGSFVTGMLTGGPIGALASTLGTLIGGFAEDVFHRIVSDDPVGPATGPATAVASTAGPAGTAAPAASPAPAPSSPAQPMAMPPAPKIVASVASAASAADQQPPGAAVSAGRVNAGLTAYARTQAALAPLWQPAQDTAYAAQGSG